MTMNQAGIQTIDAAWRGFYYGDALTEAITAATVAEAPRTIILCRDGGWYYDEKEARLYGSDLATAIYLSVPPIAEKDRVYDDDRIDWMYSDFGPASLQVLAAYEMVR